MKPQICHEKGQDLVEYALVLPLFFLLILGLAEFSLLFFGYSTISNAAREAARAGVIAPTEACDTGCMNVRIEAAARELTTGLSAAELDVLISRPSADTIRVEVVYDAHLFTRIIAQVVGGTGTITLRSSATMRLEE